MAPEQGDLTDSDLVFLMKAVKHYCSEYPKQCKNKRGQ